MNKINTQFNGYELKGLSWTANKPKANVILFEGMEEHTSRYDGFAKRLVEAGFNVYAFDYFGQGENVKEDMSNLGDWPDDGFSLYNQIINNFIKTLGNDIPVFGFAHSMGSFYLQHFIQYYPSVISRIVLCGSGFKNPALGVAYVLAKLNCRKGKDNEKATIMNSLMFGNFNNQIDNPKTNFDWLSVDEQNIKDYIDDPLCGFGPKNKFCLEFIKGMRDSYKHKRLRDIDLNTKIFIISGEFDPVTNYGKYVSDLAKLYKKIGVKDVNTKIYKGYRHEILNESVKVEVSNDIIAFYNK